MALEYGMSSDEFWKDDPDLFASYRTLFINKEKRKIEYDNHMCWLQGLYNYKSFATVYSNAWSKSSKTEYPNKPLELGINNLKGNLDKKQQAELDYKQQTMFYGTIKQRYLDKIMKGE